MSYYQTALVNTISCLSWHIFTSQVRLTRKSATLSCLERSEESLKESLETQKEILHPLAGVQNDKIISFAGNQVCHSEERRSLTEELLLSTKDSLNESLERQLLCHSKHCEETPPESPVTPLFCHSEGAQGATEESLNESLVTHRDSSVATLPQNDNKSLSSPSSEIYSHCDKNQSHKVPPLKVSLLWGIYKGARALVICWTSRLCVAAAHTCTFKPLPLIEKEKRELPANPLVCNSERYGESLRKAARQSLSHCHSEGFMPEESPFDSPEVLQVCHSEERRSLTEESLKESLVAKRDSSPVSQAQNDKLTTFTRNPKSNDSQKAHRDSSPVSQAQNDNESNRKTKLPYRGSYFVIPKGQAPQGQKFTTQKEHSMIKAKIKAKLAHYPKKFLSQLKSYFTNELNTKLDSLIMIHAQTLSLQHLEHYKQRATGGGAK